MVHTCNPSYLDHETLPGKKNSQKKDCGVAQGVAPVLNPQYHKKKKKKKVLR
jgi:hypothetical protein